MSERKEKDASESDSDSKREREREKSRRRSAVCPQFAAPNLREHVTWMQQTNIGSASAYIRTIRPPFLVPAFKYQPKDVPTFRGED